MKNVLSRLVTPALLMMLGTSSSFAQTATVASGLLHEVWADGTVVWLRMPTNLTTSCGTSSYLMIDMSLPGMKEAYALALSAFMADRSVVVHGSGACHGIYEKVARIYVSR
jgi:hypothetical protein